MQGVPTQWVGIDVGKQTLAVTILPRQLTFTVPNTAAGHRRLVARLGDQPSCLVLEATGRHHWAIQAALVAAGHPPAVINPMRIHYFRKSEGLQAKTDGLDATLLARYAAQKHPAPAVLRTEAQTRLAEQVRYRDFLVRTRDAFANRAQEAMPRDLQRRHRTMIRTLDRQIAQTAEAQAAGIAADPALATTATVLASAPGVGPVTTAVLLAELPELGTISAKAIASLAGVAPRDDQSGKADKRKHLRGGRARVRQALYMMALSATHRDPVMIAHYQQLLARGKPKKVALLACARRMLGILNAMVRESLTWEQTEVGQGRFLPGPP